ncbi:MAG: NAD-dependent epimerase/dehydratase family protein [Chloroflexota bacterium]
MHVLITGGAGFIGVNLARRLLNRGETVTILDNFSRRGTGANLEWLQTQCRTGPDVVQGDLAVAADVERAVRSAEVVYHLGGQVAVTTSVQSPRRDFEVNALGTFNVLEAARQSHLRPAVIYASTNKVYGALEGAKVIEGETRYHFAALPHGVPESFPLDFHSPYGCSKGAGDQYVRDYARIYELPTVVFRQSCIYGYRQFGIEDQGWLAWMVIAALSGKPITIYGNGKQVRDVLFIDDLLDAYDAAVDHIETARGEIYNIGGGPEQSLAIWTEFGQLLAELIGHEVPVGHGPERPGDQPIYISDIRKAESELGWTPRIPAREGIEQLVKWVRSVQESR